MVKTINDIKCSSDMENIAIEIDKHITEKEKNQLRELCSLMTHSTNSHVCFESDDKYFRLCCNNVNDYLMTHFSLFSNVKYTIINYKDFLKTKTTKGVTMKHAVIINNNATLFETEEEAKTYLETNLSVGMTGYLATNILKLEAIKKFKTTNMIKKTKKK